jgi:dTMP kinase
MFISIEGPDGAGKTTQAMLLVERLKATVARVLYVREPGGTPVGEELRRILKSGGDISPRTELLLFEAARSEIVDKVIRPALARGEVVVADRFSDSSVAYQAYGRGLPGDEVRRLNAFATSGLTPGLTFLLDLAPNVAEARTLDRDARVTTPRRFESESAEFHRRVSDGYRALAAAEPQRWRVIDASRPPDAIASSIWAQVASRLGLRAT